MFAPCSLDELSSVEAAPEWTEPMTGSVQSIHYSDCKRFSKMMTSLIPAHSILLSFSA